VYLETGMVGMGAVAENIPPPNMNPSDYGFNSFQDMANYCGAGGLQWFIHSGCWGYSSDAWRQAAALPTGILAPVPVPAAPALTPSGNAVPGTDPAQLAAGALAAGQAATEDNIQSIPDNPIPAAQCGFFSTAQPDGTCSTNYLLVGVLAIAGVVALSSIGGRRR
jgi:hypothetical protein